MRWREFNREYGGLVHALNAIIWDMLCLRLLERQGDWIMIWVVIAKDAFVVGLALTLVPPRWREIRAAPESCAVSEELGAEGLSLAGYASPWTSSACDMGLWGRLPRAVIQSILLGYLFDAGLFLILQKP